MDYEYSAKYWLKNDLNEEDTAWTFGSVISFLISIIKKIPGPIKNIAKLFDYASLANDIISTGMDIHSAMRGEIRETYKKVSGIFFHTNRDDQLANNIDEDGNHFLVRSVALAINTDTDKSIWYEPNDYASVCYNIGHSAINNIKVEPTRINSEIALKVVDRKSNSVLKTGTKTITDIIRNNEPAELLIGSAEDLYFLPNGINCFNFTAPYEGEYTFNTNSSNVVSTYIDDEIYNEENTYHLKQNQKIFIKIIGDETAGEGSIFVDISSALNNIQIGPNSRYIIKLNNFNGVYKLETEDPNVLIHSIFIIDNGKLLEYDKCDEKFLNKFSVECPMFDKELYLVLHNKSSVLSETNLNINEVDHLSTDDILNKDIGDFPLYLQFTPIISGNYLISYDNIKGNSFIFKILDDSGNTLNFNLKTIFLFDVILSAKHTYYIMMSTDVSSQNVTIAVKESNKSFSCEIREEETNKIIPTHLNDPLKVNLTVGKKYDLTFKINNHIVVKNFIINDELYSYLVTNTGVEILEDSKVGSPGLQVRAKYNEDASYDYPLTIIPEIDYSKIQFDIRNDSYIDIYLN